jgi:hypothetical protein
MSKLQVSFKHLGRIEYQAAWDYQETLLLTLPNLYARVSLCIVPW